MQRFIFKHLQEWLVSHDRKPLVLRGARQVGKTWLVRHLAETSGKKLIEINLEKIKTPAGQLFEFNDPDRILLNISAMINQTIDIENTILFFDEIQAFPELLAKLRWFAEDLPQLAVVTAGSLLEFVLANHTFSMPVGRINYMYLEPMSFEEYILANDKQILYNYIAHYTLDTDFSAVFHEQLYSLFKEYILIGGMPAAILSWINDHSLQQVNQKHHDLLSTYKNDFSKYREKISDNKIEEVMMSVPKMLGQKFVYREVNPAWPAQTIRQMLIMLSKARICHFVWSTAGNGVPLAAEKNEKFFKEIFLDVGLCNAVLDLNLMQINAREDVTLIKNGGIAEQVVGQLLRTIKPFYIEPALYYWHRHEKQSQAEVDYLIQHHNQVIPIEVKAGTTGSLKSLHLFMQLKKSQLAVRVNSAKPSIVAVDVKNHASQEINYNLLSIPFYLIGQLPRLLDSVQLKNGKENRDI